MDLPYFKTQNRIENAFTDQNGSIIILQPSTLTVYISWYLAVAALPNYHYPPRLPPLHHPNDTNSFRVPFNYPPTLLDARLPTPSHHQSPPRKNLIFYFLFFFCCVCLARLLWILRRDCLGFLVHLVSLSLVSFPYVCLLSRLASSTASTASRNPPTFRLVPHPFPGFRFCPFRWQILSALHFPSFASDLIPICALASSRSALGIHTEFGLVCPSPSPIL